MSGQGPEFFLTRMGHIFFEGTMPALVRELKRLNDNLEKLIDQKQGKDEEPKEGLGQSPVDSV